MKYWLLFFSILTCTAIADFKTSLVLENYKWSEFNNNNHRLLLENGYREGIKIFNDKLSGKILVGNVDYNGHRWNGDAVKTKTDYFLLNAEYDKKYNVLNFGFGLDVWRRNLGNGDLEVGGYSEYWNMLYGKVGITYDIFSINYCIPFYCQNYVKTVGLNPNPNPFYTISTKLDIKNYFIGFEYKNIEFKKSDIEQNVYQPKSNEEVLSLFLGIKW